MSNYLTTPQKIENVIAELVEKYPTIKIKSGSNFVITREVSGDISELKVDLHSGFVTAAGPLSSELKGFYNLYNRP
jgi:hypothetical protein